MEYRKNEFSGKICVYTDFLVILHLEISKDSNY